MELLKSRGFLFFTIIAFINAFVDLGHKIVIQNTIFKTYSGTEQIILTVVVNLLILLPYILLVTPSGFLADRFQKNNVMKYSALVAVFATLGITYCYYNGLFYEAFGLTLVLGIQSAIYSPSKYGYIKESVGDKKIAKGNGVIQAVTIAAILLSVTVFSFFFEKYIANALTPSEILLAIAPLGWVLVAFSVIELIFAFRLPNVSTPNKSPFPVKKYLTGASLTGQVGSVIKNKPILMSILGVTIFWALSQTVMAIYPSIAKDSLDVSNVLYLQGAMAMAGIGVVLGSIFAGRNSNNYIELGLVPLGFVGLAVSLLLLTGASSLIHASALFLLFGFSGALVLIPLNSMIQYHAPKGQEGKVLSVNNLIQNIGMAGLLIVTSYLVYINFSGQYIINALAALTLGFAFLIVIKMPYSIFSFLIGLGCRSRYKLEVKGFDNIPKEKGILLLGNHVSFVDWALLQMAFPRKIRFVMEKSIYQKKHIKWLLDIVGIIPVSKGNSASSLKLVAECLEQSDVVCLFPEGKLTRHGQINEFKKGFERAAKHVSVGSACIVPFNLHGLWGSKHSRKPVAKNASEFFNQRKIIVNFGKSLPIHSSAYDVKKKVHELSTETYMDICNKQTGFSNQWFNQVKKSRKEVALIDDSMGSLTFGKLNVAVLYAADKIKKINAQRVGVLLPASGGSAIVNVALPLTGKTSVNVNFTSSENAIAGALNLANVDTIITSRLFIKKLEKIRPEAVKGTGATQYIFLEDLMGGLRKSKSTQLKYLMKSKLTPAILNLLYKGHSSLSDTFTILFSSGSEGTPKGIELSERNILSNVDQMDELLCLKNEDGILSSLPTFHAFGLTVTTLMPLLKGIKIVTHADPTEVLKISRKVAEHNISLICVTSSIMGLFNRNKKVTPLMLESVRYVIAGAEKLNQQVKDSFELKFKKSVLEGYGATECTPVVSTNVNDKYDSTYHDLHVGMKSGSVGMPIIGTSVRIIDPETQKELAADEHGLIIVSGPQVMTGYLNNKNKTDESLIQLDGKLWYVTGDKGYLDKDLFLTIVDRYSNFAKIAGEMVSLSAAENEIRLKLSDNYKLSVFSLAAIPHDKKGEEIVLVAEDDLHTDDLIHEIKYLQLNPTMKPSKYKRVEKLPLLGSGKVSLKELKQLALSA